MAEILNQYESVLTVRQFNAAEARAKFARNAGLPEAASRQQTEVGVSTQVGAAVVDREGRINNVQPVHLEEDGGKNFVPPVKAVERELAGQGLVKEGEQVVLFDVTQESNGVSGGFKVTKDK